MKTLNQHHHLMSLLRRSDRKIGIAKANLTKLSGNQNQYAVVFIHGFTGHPIDTWKKDKDSLGLIDAVIHATELMKFDVYSFGYRTGLSLGHYDFQSVARLLYSEIQANIPNQNLIFVTHSMGGLAAQQYILDRYERFDHQNLKKIKGVAFLGVPFEGSKWANFSFIRNKQVKSLGKGNPLLVDLERQWHKFVYRGGIESLSKELQHTFPKLAICGARDQVVSKSSSNPFHLDATVYEVDDTHTSICKGDENSPSFKHIKNLLLKVANEASGAMILGIQGFDKRGIEGADYSIDWTNYFDINSNPRKLPDTKIWENDLIPSIKPAIDLWNDKWAQKGGKIRIYGKFCLTGGILIGRRFSRTKGVKLEVEHYGELWNADQYDPSFKAIPNYSIGNSNQSTSAVVVLSVTYNIDSAVKKYLSTIEDFHYKTIVNVLPPNGAGKDSIQDAKQATAYAIKVKETIDDLKAQGIEDISLFINAPLSLSVIIGHWLTATCPIQTFEFTGEGYGLSCRL